MRLDRKGFVRMGRLLILTLLISGCNEEQRIKWEVNKQIRRLKSKIAICFEKRFDGIDEEGRWFEKLWVFLCEFQARRLAAPVLKAAPLPTTNEPIKTGMKSWK